MAILMGLFLYRFTPSYKSVPEPPLYGMVTAKEWIPAHSDDWLMPMQSGDITIFMPMSDHVPDSYRLKVAGRIVQVERAVFDKTQIGDMYGTPPSEGDK
jgi:hypothetical protein